MKKWILIIDVEKCEDCNNCFLACKDEHCGNDWPGYAVSQPLHGHRWMNILRKERGTFPQIDIAYLPKPCLHCDDAPCIREAEGAIYRRDDGIVMIDPEKAKGRKDLRRACPHGAIWWNDEAKVAQKCTFCAHLLDDGWKAPRCVQACPTGALSAHQVEMEELEAFIRQHQLETLASAGGDRRYGVYYRNLYRFESCFIAGSVAVRKGDTADCAADLTVVLIKDGEVVAKTATDVFGDFKFDGLPEKSGEYRLEIRLDEKPALTRAVQVDQSHSVGTLWL
ncbi:MAG: 4Fe-4S dicluster domain-containing protein [Desulfobacterales bacterium]